MGLFRGCSADTEPNPAPALRTCLHLGRGEVQGAAETPPRRTERAPGCSCCDQGPSAGVQRSRRIPSLSCGLWGSAFWQNVCASSCPPPLPCPPWGLRGGFQDSPLHRTREQSIHLFSFQPGQSPPRAPGWDKPSWLRVPVAGEQLWGVPLQPPCRPRYKIHSTADLQPQSATGPCLPRSLAGRDGVSFWS